MVAIAWLATSGPAGGLAGTASPSPVTLHPTITLSVSRGVPGTAVTITGTGYPPNEIVALYIDQMGPPFLDVPGPRADPQGAFHIDISMPHANFDSAGRINPALPGPHTICGDTAYPPGQRILASACAQFQVEGAPSPSATPSVESHGTSLPELLGALVVLVVLGVGAFLWMRRSP